MEQAPISKEKIEEAIDSFHGAEVGRYRDGKEPEILKMIEQREISKEQMAQLISARYQTAHFFEDMLRRIIAKIENSHLDDQIKAPLIHSVEQNLNEELGLVEEYGGPHREGRETLLRALGIDHDQWKQNLGTYEDLREIEDSARKLIEALKRIIDEDPISAVAALYHYEDRISLNGVGDYVIILKGLENLYPELKKDTYVEGDPFWHIYSHAQHDDYHADLAKKGLVWAVKDFQDLEKLNRGLAETKEAIDKFWEKIGESIKK